MEVKDLQRLVVDEPSRVAEARRLAVAVCAALDFDETRLGEVAIVITELATNLLKHAGGGEILLRRIACPSAQEDAMQGIEILSLDRGPGIANMGQSLHDGHSTAGSPGTGLGAMRRLSSLFDIYSAPDKGTAVLSRIWRRPPRATLPPPLLAIGAVCLPLASETVCGDSWAAEQSSARALLMIADGLGHGLGAAEASVAAVRMFRAHTDSSPEELLALLHGALKSTRGAAVAVAEVLSVEGVVRYAGVGNVAARIHTGDNVRQLVSYNGIVGGEVRKIQQFEYPWPPGATLLMHSDGLATHWGLEDYPGLHNRHPTLIAGVLYRDHGRARDDVTVVVGH